MTSLDRAVGTFWSGFERVSKWQAKSLHGHWVFCDGKGQSGEPVGVHYDFLAGQLLVNYSPLSRLPPEYEQHKSYIEIFGRSIFQAVPSLVKGMQFTSKQKHFGYELHFGLEQESGMLLLQARKDGKIFDLVPNQALSGSLPNTFVDNYHHWYDWKKGTFQLRDKICPRPDDNSTWELCRATTDETAWVLSHSGQGKLLINPTSSTGDSIAAIFQPLQSRLEMSLFTCMPDACAKTLEIELPRLQLLFCLTQGSSSLISHQFRGFEIDPCQSIGTLIGLKSKLVLRDVRDPEERCCIVLDGQVSVQRYVSLALLYSFSFFLFPPLSLSLSPPYDIPSLLLIVSFLISLSYYLLPSVLLPLLTFLPSSSNMGFPAIF